MLQHDPEVHASLFVTKFRHVPDSMMTQGTAPRVQQGYYGYSSLRGWTMSHYRHVITCACHCVGNKAICYLGAPRILNKQYMYFYWNVPRLRPFVILLRLAVHTNTSEKH